MTEGFYICYEDSDSRVLDYYPRGEDKAPYATELEATQALLAYFESLHNDIVDCVVSTKTKIRMLEKEAK